MEQRKKQLRCDIFKRLNCFKNEAKNFTRDEFMEIIITILRLSGYGAELFFYGGFIDKCVYEWAILNDIRFKNY